MDHKRAAVFARASQNPARKSIRFVREFAPLMAAASSEPASEAGDACEHIEAEPMNELRFFDAARRPSEDEANLLLDCIPALVKNAGLGQSLQTRCSLGDRYCASFLPACRRSLRASSAGLFRVRMADELDDR
jgi:hypothetical protein